MIKKQLWVCVFILSFTKLFAQEYDLNTFKYRFQAYKSLGFDYNSNYNSGYNYYEIGPTQYNSIGKSRSLNFNSYLSYKNFYNTESQIKYKSIDFQIGNYGGIRKESKFYPSYYENYPFVKKISEEDVKSLSNNFELNFSNSIYKYKGKRFLWYSYSDRVQYFNKSVNVSQNSNTGLKDFNYDFFENNLHLGIGVGKGRLEYVSDAVTAWFILEDLKKKNLLENYTNEQLENLAKGVVEARNKRFLPDIRYQYIDQLALLDSTCKANNIITQDNFKNYAILHDNFIFSQAIERLSGKRITHKLILNSSSRITYDSQEEKERYGPDSYFYNLFKNYTNIYLGYFVNFEKYKQLGLKSQLNIWVSFDFTASDKYIFFANDQLKNLKNQISTFDIGARYLFQPNSRTYANFDIGVSNRLELYYDPSIFYYNFGYNNAFYNSLTISHFFSRNLVWTIDSSFRATYDIDKLKHKYSSFASNFDTIYTLNSGLKFYIY